MASKGSFCELLFVVPWNCLAGVANGHLPLSELYIATVLPMDLISARDCIDIVRVKAGNASGAAVDDSSPKVDGPHASVLEELASITALGSSGSERTLWVSAAVGTSNGTDSDAAVWVGGSGGAVCGSDASWRPHFATWIGARQDSVRRRCALRRDALLRSCLTIATKAAIKAESHFDD